MIGSRRVEVADTMKGDLREVVEGGDIIDNFDTELGLIGEKLQFLQRDLITRGEKVL